MDQSKAPWMKTPEARKVAPAPLSKPVVHAAELPRPFPGDQSPGSHRPAGTPSYNAKFDKP